MRSKDFSLGCYRLGAGKPVHIVAELGVNHNGNASMARELLKKAKGSGADSAKLQFFAPESLAERGAELCEYQQGGQAEDQLSLLKSLTLAFEDIKELKEEADKLGIMLWASVFDMTSLEAAVSLEFPVIKTGSGELPCLPLHEEICKASKPAVCSVGMATEREIEPVVRLYRRHSVPLLLLHCVSAYPAPEEELNLNSISYLTDIFRCPAGFSDHTRGSFAASLAVACGAVLIEKHFTLDRSLPGPDHSFSLDPEGFARFVESVRRTERILGEREKKVAPPEMETRQKARRSVVLKKSLRSGEEIGDGDLALLRPGTGLTPLELPQILGRKVNRDLPRGHRLRKEDLLT